MEPIGNVEFQPYDNAAKTLCGFNPKQHEVCTYSKLLECKLNFWCRRVFILSSSFPPMFAFFLMWCFSLFTLQILSFFPCIDHCIPSFFPLLNHGNLRIICQSLQSCIKRLQEADLHIFFFIQSFEFMTSEIKSDEDNAQKYGFF